MSEEESVEEEEKSCQNDHHDNININNNNNEKCVSKTTINFTMIYLHYHGNNVCEYLCDFRTCTLRIPECTDLCHSLHIVHYDMQKKIVLKIHTIVCTFRVEIKSRQKLQVIMKKKEESQDDIDNG